MFNLAFISHFYAVVIRIIRLKCAGDVITLGLAAIALCHRLTANHRLTATVTSLVLRKQVKMSGRAT